MDLSIITHQHDSFRQELKLRATKEEIIVKEFLESEEYIFTFQRGFIVPFHRIVDFCIFWQKQTIILEIDGGYHKEPKTIWKDQRKDRLFLKDRGIRTIRITNTQVNSGAFRSLLSDFLMEPTDVELQQIQDDWVDWEKRKENND